MDDVAADAGAPARGSVVLAHGLNTTPAVMDELAAVLRRHGYACAHVALHPATDSRRRPGDIAEDWTRAFDEVHDRLTAEHPGLPVSAVGYSLGGLLAVLRAARTTGTLRRLVLWAPPLSLTRTAGAVRLLTPAHRMGLRLPSAAPKEARARSATPLAEYEALLRLVDRAATVPRADLAGTSALVLLAAEDPLVDRAGVTRWVEDRRLTGWRVHLVDVRGAATAGHRHLLVSETVLGPQEWHDATQLMLAHLDAGDDKPSEGIANIGG